MRKASSTFRTASYFRFSALQSKQKTLPLHIVSDHSSSVRTGRSGKAKWQANTSPIYPCKQASRDGHPKSEKIHGEIIHNNRKCQGKHSRRREQKVCCEHDRVCWTDPARRERGIACY